ncbi:glycosyltransferase family 2 protein [Bifidobacterium jacchi]|uniref:Glycosyltransferase n=1 Tax=Bifidobacterium jacchi TaxID=2490545 RepID=A0A5N5RIV8_9BIFI|nr:glycosyltransferase family 2 protein [Bifidobacterium jacchi]KAB5606870.1 glycosyltransferase [Bifidobacterium jacchi]
MVGNQTVSIVVPCHNEEACMPLLLPAIAQTSRDLRERWPGTRLELVLVDDGSTDRTATLIEQEARSQQWSFAIRWLSLSRNFGKESALLAGLDAATGDLVAVMDADLQDPPSMLIRMARMLDDDAGIDCVGTRRVTRKGEPPIRSLFSRLFYRIMNALSPVEVPDGARDFRLMRRRVVDAVTSLPERNRFSKGLFAWVGFRTAWIEYPNVPRAAGRTNWSFMKLAKYALDGLVSCSTAPLRVASYIGLILCMIAFVATCFIAVRAAAFGDPVAGWPSLTCIVTFIGGLQLMCLGIIGQYLARTYLESKNRPNYIVRNGNVPISRGGQIIPRMQCD